MLKIWCEKCEATGITYLNSSDELCGINGEDCLNCQGKGWVGLEASVVGDKWEIDTFATADMSEGKNFEVYIKEIKEEKE